MNEAAALIANGWLAKLFWSYEAMIEGRQTASRDELDIKWHSDSKGRRDCHSGLPGVRLGTELIGFGRWRERTLKEVTPTYGSRYARWLLGQSWLYRKCPTLYQTVRALVLSRYRKRLRMTFTATDTHQSWRRPSFRVLVRVPKRGCDERRNQTR